MNNTRIANELIKIAKQMIADNEQGMTIPVNREGIKLNEKIYNTKTKQGITSLIHKYIDPHTKGLFYDTAWENVFKVQNALDNLGINVIWNVINGGYSPDGSSKTYKFEFDVTNFQGKTFNISGQLICCSAGPVDNPWSCYDMIFQIF